MSEFELHSQGIIGLALDLSRQKQILVLFQLDPKLHSSLESDNILFCQDNLKLKDMFTQISSTLENEHKTDALNAVSSKL